MRKIMASLDIGSDSIKLVVGEIFRNKFNVLVSLSNPTKGMKDNTIVDANSLKEVLKNTFNKASNIIGLPIKQVIMTIAPKDLEFSVINGSIPIENNNKKVKGIDVVHVLKDALKNQIREDREYITLLPTSFTLDDGKKVRDPKGFETGTLKARGVLITTSKSYLYPLLLLLESIGIEVIDIGLNAIGDYYEYKINDMKDVNGIIINVGHESTNISLFNKGVLTQTEVVNIGGKNIDNDISYIFKTSLDVSKKLKETFALAYSKNAKENVKQEVENKNGEKIVINQKEITKIVESRIEEILNLCKKKINILTKKEISYIIITGGLTECRDFSLILNKIFKEKAIIGRVTEMGVRHNKYGSSVGLIKYYDDKSKLKDREYSIFSIEEQQALGGYDLDEKNNLSLAELFKNLWS